MRKPIIPSGQSKKLKNLWCTIHQLELQMDIGKGPINKVKTFACHLEQTF